MDEKQPAFSIRSSIWIVDETGEVIFGIGRLKILEVIHQTGSIHAAAKALNMSYRAVWGRIHATEKRLGKPLLVKSIGGASGGGSSLTPFAFELMDRFRIVHRQVVAKADTGFAETLVPFFQNHSSE